MLITGFTTRPILHSLMAMINRWPSKANSSRTVLLARGIGFPLWALGGSDLGGVAL
jgi:hypothetical protein